MAMEQLYPLTYEDLLALPDDVVFREIIGGELILSPAPRRRHQELSAIVYDLLRNHVRPRGLGRVYYAPVDVRLSPFDIVQPDLVVLSRDRLGTFEDAIVEGPPDLVVEILSPSNRGTDLIRKAALYANRGVPEYWISDPDQEWFRINVLAEGRYVPVALDADGRLRSVVLPDLVVDPAALFAELRAAMDEGRKEA